MTIDPQQYEQLPAYPSNGAADLPNGKYVVAYDIAEELVTTSSEYQERKWFRTTPLDEQAIARLQSVQLVAESHDQGFCENPDGGDWTWFELSIMEHSESHRPRIKDGVELTWESHNNKLAQPDFNWEAGKVFEGEHDMFRLLEPGNVLSVRLRSRFAGWAIYARAGYLVLELGEPVAREPLNFGQVVSNVQGMQRVMQDINREILPSSALKINAVSNQLFRAEMIHADDSDRPLRVLSLDGGGVRGIAALMLLQKVMEQAAPGKKPCEVFDMIGGTSTGGFIAIMLGRLRMTVEDALTHYRKFMDEVFPKSWWPGWAKTLTTGEKWSAKPLEKVIKQLIREKLGKDPEQVTLMDEESQQPGACRIFVMAVNQAGANNCAPAILRSYKNPLEQSAVPDILLWQAARATSAAPTYFEPMTVKTVVNNQPRSLTFVDGGLQANNPLGWMWNEVLSIYGPARETNCFLSIGTGIAASQSLDGLVNLATNLSGVATNSEVTNILFRSLLNAFAPRAMGKKYWRFNVGDGLPDWVEGPDKKMRWVLGAQRVEDKNLGELDDVDAIPETEKKARAYIDLPAAKQLIKECAQTLRVVSNGRSA